MTRRHAVVTGAGTGIGRAIARRLASEGFELSLLARRRDPLEQAARELDVRTCVVAAADGGTRAHAYRAAMAAVPLGRMSSPRTWRARPLGSSGPTPAASPVRGSTTTTAP